MHRTSSYLIPPLVALLAGACGDTGTNPQPLAPGPDQQSSASSVPFRGFEQIRSFDAEMEDLVGRIPGFGGMYVEEGRLNVYVKGKRRVEPEERAVLDRFLARHVSPASRPPRGTDGMVVVPARFDFRELRSFHRHVDALMPDLQVTITDIDERNNRVLLGVATTAAADAARRALVRARLPEGAVEVQVVAPAVLDVVLTDHVRPTMPGTRIAAPGGCTLSFNGYRAVGSFSAGWSIDYSQGYFVTNSHCTSTYVGYDGGTAGQPNALYPIGFEIADPAPFTNAQNAECPVGRNCRWGDAALFQYHSGVSFTYASVPTVSGFTITGSRTITGHNMPWFIWGPMSVRKIGATSGESSGSLVTTCARIPVYDGGTYMGVDMLCQYQATYSSSPGDSGSPVLNPSSETETILYGVHWGRQYSPNNGILYSTFSPLGSMQTELNAASGVSIVPCDACIAWWIE